MKIAKRGRPDRVDSITAIASDAAAAAVAAAVLDDLADVTAPSPDDGDLLTWDDGTSQWVNAAPSGGPGGGSRSFSFFMGG
jgi:hypothetical protein